MDVTRANIGMSSPQVSLGELFIAFFLVGIQGFGGVNAYARAMLVEQRRWLSAVEYNEIAGLCQILPGPNTLNVAVLVGAKFQQARGAFLTVFGLLVGPVILILMLGALYSNFRDLPWVGRLITGISAGAAGLVLATAIKMALPLWRSPLSLLVVGLAFLAVGMFHLPLVPVFLTLAPLAIVLSWWRAQ